MNFKMVSRECCFTGPAWYVHCVQVEKEIFDKMDNLFSTGLGDGEYKELFVDM